MFKTKIGASKIENAWSTILMTFGALIAYLSSPAKIIYRKKMGVMKNVWLIVEKQTMGTII